MADIQQLFQQAQQMQGRLQQLQTELASRLIEATAGGGMVRVVADGQANIRSVTIDPRIFEERDAEFLSDLVTAAVADAQRRAQEMMQSEMRKMQPLPFNFPL